MESEEGRHEDAIRSKERLKHLNRQGNVAFVGGNMHEAIQKFSELLEIAPQETEVLSNRGAALIRVKKYNQAKNDLYKCLQLELLEPNIKTIGRLAKSLWGLKQYDEIIGFLETVLEWNADKTYRKGVLNLIATSRSMKNESATGKYNMQELIKKQQQTYDCADYVGPVTVQNIIGKGRGLVAAENIQRGQVLLGTKAFAIVLPNQGPRGVIQTRKVNPNGDEYMEDSRHSQLVAVVTDILRANPETRKEFFKLYAGPKLKHMEIEATFSQGNPDAGLTVEDLERINWICYYNSYFTACNPNPNKKPNKTVIDEIRSVNSYGLWILPSYLNHSCVNINCDSQKYGDFFILRAIKNITKGDELLISYFVPTKTYVERQLDMRGYGFQCRCQLCQIEEHESQQIHQQRAKLMEQFVETCRITEDEESVPFELIKSQLEALRPENPALNFSLFWINRQMGYCQKNNQNFKTAATHFASSYRLSNSTCLGREGIRFALQTAICYNNANDIVETKKWLNTFIEELKGAYGTSSVLSTIAERDNIVPDQLIQLMQKYEITN